MSFGSNLLCTSLSELSAFMLAAQLVLSKDQSLCHVCRKEDNKTLNIPDQGPDDNAAYFDVLSLLLSLAYSFGLCCPIVR